MSVPQSRFIILLVALLLNSCSYDLEKNNSSSTRDSLLNNLLKMTDTLPYYDTSNLNFKLLRAYKENDTSSLKELSDYISRTSKTPWMHDYLKPCAVNTEFDTLTADEAYKFSYQSSFCEYYTITSIVKRGDKIKTTATVYRNASRMDSLPCRIAQHYEMEIDSASWAKFEREIEMANFWGSKQDNENRGFDGSSLDVQGYRKYFRGNRGRSAKKTLCFPMEHKYG